MYVKTKGIILAGGRGTRLYPMTGVFSKQLQPVYDKPMIYYPLSTLMLAGIRDVLIISTPQDTPNFEALLGDGGQWGINLEYAVQDRPGGIAEAFLYGRDFIGGDQVCLILGDNLFYGKLDYLRRALARNGDGATIFGYQVQHPERYGVVEFNRDGRVLGIEEKPLRPRSKFAVPGLYVYEPGVVQVAEEVKPSARGEREITDVNLEYLRRDKLQVERMGRGIAWLDTGTPDSLIEAGMFIHTVEKRQGYKIACLEEIAVGREYISREDYARIVAAMPNGTYRDYCARILQEIEQGL